MNSIIHSTHPDMSKLPGGFEPKSINIDFDSTCLSKTRIKEVSDSTLILHNVFSKDDCNKLINLMMQSPNFESVSIQGRKDIPDARIGSIRTTVWSPELAEKFYKKMYYMFEPRFTNEFTATDWWQGNKERKAWLPNGVSPMLRMMRYEKSGQHYAHYDAAFIYPEDRFRTLMSFVVYLTTNDDGATRFINDKQSNIPIWDRDHKDWIREAREDEVIFKSKPVQGDVLLFDHRLCHDVEKYTGDGPRIIIRGDVLYKAY